MTKRGIRALMWRIVIGLAVVLVMVVWNQQISRAREAANRSNCAVNLKSIGIAFAIYATQYPDPVTILAAADATWLCDEEKPAAGSATGALATLPAGTPSSPGFDVKKLLYCPSNARQNPGKLWPMGVWGYASLYDRGSAAVGMPVFPKRLGVPLSYVKPEGQDPEQMLLLDWIVSDKGSVGGANFTTVERMGARAGIYGTSHMSGGVPAGAYVLYGDGHVAWWQFAETKAVAIKQGGVGEAFMWVPNP